MKLEDLVLRIGQLIERAGDVERTVREVAHYSFVNDEAFRAFQSSSLSFLAATFGEQHSHFRSFTEHVEQATLSATQRGRGILRAAKEDLEGGWLRTTKGLISAEIFADFIQMAEHLLAEDYKDPAAVIVGSVIEEHLRQLCQSNGVATSTVHDDGTVIPLKADRLNAELVKAGVYNKLDQKSVTAWLDLRNKAAHGHYDEYSREQVALMLQGATDFMSRNPA